MAKTDPTKKILLSVADGPEGIEIYTSEDEAVVDWSSAVPSLYLTANTIDAYVKLGPFQLLLPQVKLLLPSFRSPGFSGDVEELLKLAGAVIQTRGIKDPSSTLVYVNNDALLLLEDWIVNRFGEE
jgi:hypothetical protein